MSLVDAYINENLADIVTEYLGMEDIITLKLLVTDQILESKIVASIEQMTADPSHHELTPTTIESLTATVLLDGVPKIIKKHPSYILQYPPFLAKLIFKQFKPRQITKLVRSIMLDTETEHILFKLAAKYVLKHKMTELYGPIVALAVKGSYKSIIGKVLSHDPVISLSDFDIDLGDADFDLLSGLVDRALFDINLALSLVMNPDTAPVLIKALAQHPQMRNANTRKEVLTTFLTFIPYKAEVPNITTFFENSYFEPKEIYSILQEHCLEDETNTIQILLGLNVTIAGTTPYLWNKLSKQMEQGGCDEAATLYRYRANIMKMKHPKSWVEYIDHMSTL